MQREFCLVYFRVRLNFFGSAEEEGEYEEEVPVEEE
jgi:hypothetical protein